MPAKVHKGYIKEFDKWIDRKKALHNQISSPPHINERDVWWTSIGVNIGFEEDGKNENFVRPVLIVKKFNNEIFLGVPLSTKIKDNKYYIQISIKDRTVSAMISQLRVFSTKRIWNKLVELDKGDYSKILEEIKSLFILPFLPKQEGRG